MNSPLSAEQPDLLPAHCDRRVLLNLAKNLADLIFVLDPRGLCVFCYTRVPDFLFFKPEQFLGQELSAVLPPEMQTLTRALRQALANQSQPSPLEYSSPDGKQRYRVVFEPITGYEAYLVAQVRNITEHYFARRLLLGLPAEGRAETP